MANVGLMKEQAIKRKERLKAMKQKSSLKTGNEEEPPGKMLKTEDEDKLPRPVFRSYKPQDDSLLDNQLPKAKPVEVEEQVKDQLEAAKPQTLVEEVDLINLAPRKPDWDLKRDVSKKLEKLEKRTQRAIAELIRDRLMAGKEDLASVVSAATNQDDEDED